MVSKCVNSRLEEGSREYFEHGEYLVQENMSTDSLAFFRTAVRMCPGSGYYLQRLGEIEFSVGLYDLASKRFQKALTLDGSDKFALESYMVKPQLQFHRADHSEKDDGKFFPPLPEHSIEVVMNHGLSTFFDHPFVIRKAFEPSTFDKFSDLTLLKTIYGAEFVEFYPQNMQIKPTKVYHVNLDKALSYFDYPDGAYVSSDVSEVGAYIQWNINSSHFDRIMESQDQRINLGPLDTLKNQLQEFINEVTGSFQTETDISEALIESFARRSHWYMMLIGEENSGMFMHNDNLPVGSWQMELTGNKKWVICSSDNKMNIDGQRTCSDQESMNGVCLDKESCGQAVVFPGDILYYPPQFWHQTTCLSKPTISLSGTVVTETRRLLDAIRDECKHNIYGYGFDVEFCRIIVGARP